MKRLSRLVVLGLAAVLPAPAPAQAAIATTASPATAALTSTLVLTDTATLSALAAQPDPADTVTFDLFGPLDTTCVGPPIATSTITIANITADGATATSDPFTPANVGVYRWTASFTGDVNNPPEATLCNDAGESETVTQALPTITTTAPAGVTLGGPDALTDSATVTGIVNPAPGQSVTFRLYGPGDATCANVLVTDPEVLTLDVSQTSGTAQAQPVTPTAAGDYRWVATYAGDPNNAAVSGACGDATETTTVAKATPAIATTASPDITVGAGTVFDQATVSGGVSPTGTVTFDLYGPGDATCANAPVFTDTAPLGVAGTAQSTTFAPATAGVYRWRAAYGGDANNTAVSGACNDAGETATVNKSTPTIATLASPDITLGGTLSDEATVSRLVHGSAGANVTFELYGPGDTNCAGAPVFSSIQSGLLDLAQTTLVAQSGDATPVAAGVHRWRATYNGDVNNNAVAGACNAPNESRTVGKATPALTSRASAPIALGAGSLTDTATATGVAGTAPTGTLTFQLYGPDDSSCTGGSVFSDTRALTAAGQGASATSAPFTPMAAGVYRWRVVFAGDANYLTVATACNDSGESAAVGPVVRPPPAPPPPPVPLPPPPPPPPSAAARATCNALVATIVGTGQARLIGTSGDDVIVGTNAAETIDGRGGDDTICAGGGADKVNGGADQDVVFGGAGDDELRGGSGNDRLFGEAGADLVLGGAGDDDLHGGRGRDRLAGGDGFDSVDGEAGDDVLDETKLGGAGRDRLIGGSGGDRIRTRGGSADVVDCGSGRDTVTLDSTDRQKRCENVRR